jgi:threonine-phosphate decarboxylase
MILLVKNQQILKRGVPIVKSHLPAKVVHGGIIKRLQESRGGEYLDFSANLNPFPPEIPWKPDFSLVSHYPDDSYHQLKESIARLFRIKEEEICVGNGSVEIIRSFCHAVLSPGDRVTVKPPTFGEYALSAAIAGGSAVPEDGDAVVRFLCNPNNPDGLLVMREELDDILAGCERRRQLLFLDEAFIELADPGQSMIRRSSPFLFVLRSLTKSFAVPGLRIGFGVGDPDLIAKIEMIRPPWTLNAFAEDYALKALEQYDGLEESRRRIRIEREWLQHELDRLGLPYTPSSTNFILIDLCRNAGAVAGAMLEQGILVLDCASFGLTGSIRIAVRRREENIRLMEALEKCLH